MKKAKIEEILRVNHSGELGAKYIYLGQLSVLKENKAIQEMYQQELEHLAYFEKQLVERRVRPSLFTPFWKIGGFILGAVSARISENTAMACTVAIEEVIGNHYQEQYDLLEGLTSEQELLASIEKFKADELGHVDIGLEHGALDAPAYKLFSRVIKLISKISIATAKKL